MGTWELREDMGVCDSSWIAIGAARSGDEFVLTNRFEPQSQAIFFCQPRELYFIGEAVMAVRACDLFDEWCTVSGVVQSSILRA